jgi:hypothetical protein
MRLNAVNSLIVEEWVQKPKEATGTIEGKWGANKPSWIACQGRD